MLLFPTHDRYRQEWPSPSIPIQKLTTAAKGFGSANRREENGICRIESKEDIPHSIPDQPLFETTDYGLPEGICGYISSLQHWWQQLWHRQPPRAFSVANLLGGPKA